MTLLALLSALLLPACEETADTGSGSDTAGVGGNCTYEETHGTCTFVDATGGSDVTFDFVSDDGTVTDTYMLYVGDGGTPPTQACLDELGVAPGVSVGCTLGTILTGTCSPTVYTFDDFDTNACLD